MRPPSQVMCCAACGGGLTDCQHRNAGRQALALWLAGPAESTTLWQLGGSAAQLPGDLRPGCHPPAAGTYTPLEGIGLIRRDVAHEGLVADITPKEPTLT